MNYNFGIGVWTGLRMLVEWSRPPEFHINEIPQEMKLILSSFLIHHEGSFDRGQIFTINIPGSICFESGESFKAHIV